jgi:hypothetical protein
MLGGKWVLPLVMTTFHALWFSVDEAQCGLLCCDLTNTLRGLTSRFNLGLSSR